MLRRARCLPPGENFRKDLPAHAQLVSALLSLASGRLVYCCASLSQVWSCSPLPDLGMFRHRSVGRLLVGRLSLMPLVRMLSQVFRTAAEQERGFDQSANPSPLLVPSLLPRKTCSAPKAAAVVLLVQRRHRHHLRQTGHQRIGGQ